MTAAQKPLTLCRSLLGFGLFIFYLSFAYRLQPYFGTPKLFGHELGFLQIPHLIEQPALSIGRYCLALVSSVLFAVGYRTRSTGIASLLLHSLFHGGGSATYGWSGMIDPALLCLILATFEKKPSAWPLRLLQISVCG